MHSSKCYLTSKRSAMVGHRGDVIGGKPCAVAGAGFQDFQKKNRGF